MSVLVSSVLVLPFVVATEVSSDCDKSEVFLQIAGSRGGGKSHTLGKILEALVVRHIGGWKSDHKRLVVVIGWGEGF